MLEDKITVIVTVYNEKDNIADLVKSLHNQSLEPYEIIITDAHSTDGTWEILTKLKDDYPKLKVVSVKGNRSVGRNTAISLAKTEYIAVTDAGCLADYNWLEHLFSTLSKGADVASGFYEPLSDSKWEKTIAKMTIPTLETVNPDTFLPSSRSVAFRKSAWQKVGGYPEEFSHNEDTPFDLLLKEAGFEFVFVPQAIVYWRPRQDLKAVFKQFFYYALGDGEARIQIKDYLFIYLRYIPLFFYPYGTIISLLFWCQRIFKDLKKTRSLLFIPLRFTIDFADMSGFLAGLKEAWQRCRQRKS